MLSKTMKSLGRTFPLLNGAPRNFGRALTTRTPDIEVSTEATKSALKEKFNADSKKAKAPRTPLASVGDSLKHKPDVHGWTDGQNTWRLTAAVAMTRFPVVASEPLSWEQEHLERMINMRERIAKKYPAGWSKNAGSPKNEDDEGVDVNKHAFKPAPIRTAADETNDRYSLERALTEELYLILKNGEGQWRFPERAWRNGETMRQTAERAVLERVGMVQLNVRQRLEEEEQRRLALEADKVEVEDEVLSIEEQAERNLQNNAKALCFLAGNSPASAMEITFEKPKEGCDGEKVFFFRGRFLEGDVQPDGQNAVDHQWVTRSELAEYLDPAYMECVQRVL